MTAAETTQYLSEEAFSRRQRRQNVLLGVALVLAFAAIVAGLQAFIVNNEQGASITRIEQTPCAKDPSSPGCERLRIEVEQSATKQITCIPFHRAGYRCPKPGSLLAEGGDATSTPNTGNSQPGPAQGPTGDSGSSGPPTSPPVSESAPVNLAPALEGATETVCSVNALGIEICK